MPIAETDPNYKALLPYTRHLRLIKICKGVRDSVKASLKKAEADLMKEESKTPHLVAEFLQEVSTGELKEFLASKDDFCDHYANHATQIGGSIHHLDTVNKGVGTSLQLSHIVSTERLVTTFNELKILVEKLGVEVELINARTGLFMSLKEKPTD